MAIFVPTRQRTYYFDSFGDEPNEQLKGFLKTFPQVIRNTNTLQAISSNYCGHYCIFFVFNMSLPCTSFGELMRRLERTGNPDRIVHEFVECLLNE